MFEEKLHLIMPMGGKGSRFAKYGYEFPKPLLDIKGRPFFYWATQSIVKFISVKSLIFVVLQEHIDKYNIDKEIKKYYPDAKIHVIPEVLNGAVLTCLEGIKEVDDDSPILFNDCDHIFRCRKFEDFCNNGFKEQMDGALLTFWSDEDKYSFLRFNEQGNVTETVEKKVISNDAICGCYYFANKDLFQEAVDVYLKNCNYQEYFVSGVYNVMAESNKVIKAFQTDFHIPFGVPEEYEEAQKSNCFEELR